MPVSSLLLRLDACVSWKLNDSSIKSRIEHFNVNILSWLELLIVKRIFILVIIGSSSSSEERAKTIYFCRDAVCTKNFNSPVNHLCPAKKRLINFFFDRLEFSLQPWREWSHVIHLRWLTNWLVREQKNWSLSSISPPRISSRRKTNEINLDAANMAKPLGRTNGLASISACCCCQSQSNATDD